MLSKRQQAALTSAYVLLNDSYNNYKDKLKELYGEEAHQKIVDAIAAEKAKDVYITSTGLVRNSSLDFEMHDRMTKGYSTMPIPIDISKVPSTELFRRNII